MKTLLALFYVAVLLVLPQVASASACAAANTDTDGDGIDDIYEDTNSDTDCDDDDSDGDGLPNYLDVDDDGDGIATALEDPDPNNDGDPSDAADSDSTGDPDYLETDSDGDGVPDQIEGEDENADGMADRFASGSDLDGDGLDDTFDPDSGGVPMALTDTDGDGTPNFQDPDDDGDGVDTIIEGTGDSDADGIPDYLDPPEPFEPNPHVTFISDVADDQGGQVWIGFDASGHDDLQSAAPILQYEVFRRADFTLPEATGLHAAPRTGSMHSDSAILGQGWVFTNAVPAHGEPSYLSISPTLADSTEAGMRWSVFFVRAATSEPLVFFDSTPDSGFSIDNLAPSVPQGITIAHSASGNQLDWDPPIDPDFRYFRIYRSADPSFPVSTTELVHATTDPTWSDPISPGWGNYYRITSVDFAGNESDPAEAETMTAAPSADATRFGLHSAFPNPFNPRVRLQFELDTSAITRLEIYDVAGRRVRTLREQMMNAGPYEVIWEGKDDLGRSVGSGIYFVRLSAGRRNSTLRVSLVR